MRALLARWAERSRSRLDPGRPEHDPLWVTTEDGWRLPLARLHGPRTGPVVILCPGLGGNARCFDLPGTLGVYLASRGCDVFLAELRGGQASIPPNEEVRFDVRLRDWVADCEAVSAVVRRVALDQPLAWVGHSLGGLAALLSSAQLARIVTLGTTLCFDGNVQLQRTLRLAIALGEVCGQGRSLPQATLGAIEAPLMGHFDWPAQLSWISPPGLERTLTQQLHALAVEDLPLSLLRELELWAGAASGGSDWVHERARRQQAEVLMVAGAADGWAPLASVRRSRSLLLGGGARASLLELSKARVGQDYGHAALLFGREREAQVYQPLLTFLA